MTRRDAEGEFSHLDRTVDVIDTPTGPVNLLPAGDPRAGRVDDRPCGFLLFGPPYDRTAAEARDRGWAVEHLPGGHLHQLVDPGSVAARHPHHDGEMALSGTLTANGRANHQGRGGRQPISFPLASWPMFRQPFLDVVRQPDPAL
ncbi:hypothetical protein Asp14428_15290 [Actinoplanes sp. NBRC 14428]|nr:hypothetical protein Asp14428_15290 [Actinoplanes sp. NBRC 14428]